MSNKKALLVVSFGTSHPGTCERTIAAIERDLAAAFPDRELRRAFTSRRIVRKLYERDGVLVNTVSMALQALVDEGCVEVLVQPTHVMNGEEYDNVVRECTGFDRRIAMRLGAPLLTSPDDYRALAGVLSESYPVRPGTAVCWMGHGTAHYADSAYAALEYHFGDIGRQDMLVGTVEGFPDLDALRRRLVERAPRRVRLVPLMVVAGDHAVNDMAGDGEDSWKTVLEADGYTVECELRGLGEVEGVRALYVEHAQAARPL